MTGFPTQAFANLVILLLTIPLALAAWRMVRGPGVADRFVAFDMLTAVAVALSAAAALATGYGAFLDVGLGLALINFVASAALAAFLERKGTGDD